MKIDVSKEIADLKELKVKINSTFNKIQMLYILTSFLPLLNLLKTFLVDDGYSLFISLSIISFLLGLVVFVFSLFKKENIFIVFASTFFVSLFPIYALLSIGIISFQEIVFHAIQLSKFKLTD